jgi:hypothetical protein
MASRRDPADSGGPAARHAGPALLAVAVGSILAGAGFFHLVSAVTALPGRAVLDVTRSGPPPAATRLAAGAASLVSASGWRADAEELGQSVSLYLRAAQITLDSAAADRWRLAAREGIDRALSLAPGQPLAWLQLAYLRRGDKDTDGALAAFRMSLLTGSFVPELMISRTTLGFDLLDRMNPETRALFQRHTAQTWVVAPDYVAALGRDAALADFVKGALKGLTDEELARAHRIHGRRPP